MDCDYSRRYEKREFFPLFLYEILKERRRSREEIPSLKHLIVKIAQLNRKQFLSIFIDKHESTQFQGQNPSLSHLLQLRERPFSWMITGVTEKDVITERPLGNSAKLC